MKDVARLVAERVGCRTVTLPSSDPRSYRQNSDKLLAAGFRPKHTVANAIDELIAAYAAGQLRNDDRCYNLKAMPKAA